MRNSWLVLLLFLSSSSWAQKHTFLNIAPKFFNQDFQLNTNYVGLDGVTVTFDHFMYYISDVKIIHDGGQIHNVIPSVFIAKPDTFSFYLGELSLTTIEQIQFMVGVPQRLNIQSGAEAQDISVYPASHPLSFQSPSMYWGWQAGYMHMIVGGYADGNNDQNPETYFEMHNLGNNNQKVVNQNIVATQTTPNQIDLYMECHLEQWLYGMPLSTVGILHDQTGLNGEVMKNIDNHPVFVQPLNAATAENQHSYAMFTFDKVFHWKHLPMGTTEVYDLTGALVFTHQRTHSEGNVTLTLNPGNYVFSVKDLEGNLVKHEVLRITEE